MKKWRKWLYVMADGSFLPWNGRSWEMKRLASALWIPCEQQSSNRLCLDSSLQKHAGGTRPVKINCTWLCKCLFVLLQSGVISTVSITSWMNIISYRNVSWPYESPLGKEHGEYLRGQRGAGKRSVSIPSSCWKPSGKLILLSLQKKVIADSGFFLKRI